MSPETTYISVEGDNPRFQPRLCTLNVSGPPCPLRSRELPVSVPGSPLTPASLDIRGLSVHHCDHLPVILKAVTPSTLGLGGGRCTGPGEHGHSDACARMPQSPNDVPYPGPNQEPTRAETGCPVVNAEATNSLRQRSGPAPRGEPRDLTRISTERGCRFAQPPEVSNRGRASSPSPVTFIGQRRGGEVPAVLRPLSSVVENDCEIRVV